MKLFHLIPIYWLYIDHVFASVPPIVRSIASQPSSSHEPDSTPPKSRPLPQTDDNVKGGDRHVHYHKSCGVSVPSLEDWSKGKDKEVREWLKPQYQAFFDDKNYDNFAEFMRDKFAPNVTPFSLSCDGLNFCSIGNCMQIDANLSAHDRQMAYYVFESLSGIHATYHMLGDSMNEITHRLIEQAKDMVQEYTYTQREKTELIKKEQRKKMIFMIGLVILLIAAAILTPIAPGLTVAATAAVEATVEGISLASSVVSTVANIYVSATNIIGNVVTYDGEPVEHAEKVFTKVFGQVEEAFNNKILSELTSYMTGQVVGGINLETLIGSGLFVQPDVFKRHAIRRVVSSFLYGAAVNALWRETGDHPYIVQTLALNGNCNTDWRGPEPNRVCLPERPEFSYWLYFGVGVHTHNHNIKGPPGFLHFLKPTPEYYYITVQDIVRSSLWVHENNYEEKFQKVDAELLNFIKAGNVWGDKTKVGNVPGAFTLAICENPEGEAISSVWERRGHWKHSSTNHPCMCGPGSWQKLGKGTKEQKKFLTQSGLLFSRDFRHSCHRQHHCHFHKDSWNWNFPRSESRKIEVKNQWSGCRGHAHRSPGNLEGDKNKDGAWKA